MKLLDDENVRIYCVHVDSVEMAAADPEGSFIGLMIDDRDGDSLALQMDTLHLVDVLNDLSEHVLVDGLSPSVIAWNPQSGKIEISTIAAGQ